MNLKRKISLKKITAISAASVLILSSSSSVLAEGTVTYADREREALQSLISSITEDWDAQLAEVKESGTNAKANITLKAEDAGRSILAMFAGETDLTWFDTLSMDMDVSVADGQEIVNTDVLLNNALICSLDLLVDMAEGTEYMQIPEISPGILKVSLTEEADGEYPAETMEALSVYSSDPAAFLPDGATLSALLDRYGNIILNHMEEGASTQETLSVEGISEDCTVLEGQLDIEAITETARDILTTAQTDEDLAALLTKWSEAFPDLGDLNAQMQDGITESLALLDENTEEDTSGQYILSRMWVNADNKIVGREFSMMTGVEAEASFIWKAPSDGTNTAFLVDMISEGTSQAAVSGTGTVADGIVDGTYSILTEEVVLADVQVSGFDLEKGTGKFVLTFPTGDAEEEYNPLSAFALSLEITADEAAGTEGLILQLLSADVPLATLSVTGQETDEAAAPLDIASGTVYDVANEEDMDAYAAELNLDTIFTNIQSAGVPDQVIEMIVNSLMETEEEYEDDYYEDDYYEDDYVEDDYMEDVAVEEEPAA